MKLKERVTPEKLRSFFSPKSIALIGATDNSMWSLSTYMNLKKLHFPGSVYCVHPYKEYVHGESTYKSVKDIDEPIDLAYIMVSTKHVLQVMQDAYDANIHNLVLLTAGFSEIGDKGLELEQEILTFAEEHDQIILGPNGNGFINVTEQLTPFGLPLNPPLVPGPVGVVLQSGALASSIMTLSQSRHIGLSLLVSVGNESMITTTDIIDYLIEDKSTKVITLFLESIREPEEFIRVSRKALQYGKPIVVLKIGRSMESARSAMAHTGALVGDDAINDAVFRQYGVIRVQSLEDLIITAGLMGYVPKLPGRNMGVVTPSGGACDIISDRAQDEQILLPEFSLEIIERLKNIVPDFSTVHNPLDVTGYVVVDRTLMVRALETISSDTNLDFILCLMEPPRIKPEDPTALFKQYDRLKKIIEKSKCPVIFITNTGIDITSFGRTMSDKGSIHFVGGMEHGMKAIGKALWWYEKHNASSMVQSQPNLGNNKIETTNGGISPGQWSEIRTREFLQEHGVPIVPGKLANGSQEAVIASKQIGFPVAMKIQSEDFAHKSDVGGVALNLQTEQEVEEAYINMIENLKMEKEMFKSDGVLISPMRKGGIELLVGVIKDPVWGLTLAVGMGGIFVEILKDTSLRVLPVSREEIKEMLEELNGAPALKGARGIGTVNIEDIANAICKITNAAMSIPELKELEVNPLLVQEDRVEALDALAIC